ncbi:hypothetical protein [Clostridium sp. B9]|uniref:hypothetical protein n=1 Tax=Clostridium sp. B9 TaxID=3423224 RepID=UPI003D2ED62C
MSKISIILFSLITINILLLILLLIINIKINSKRKLINSLLIIFILSLLGLVSSVIYLNNITTSPEYEKYISDKPSSVKEFNINNNVNPDNKEFTLNDEVKSIVYNVVSDEFGENFKYTKDFLINSDGTYTISLLFDDTNYSEEQCKEFIEKLSSNLKSFKNVGRIEIYFLNNFKIKYSLIIDNFNEGNNSVIIKEDAF